MPSVKKGRNSKVEGLSKREEKKKINIRWNSGLYFQIGLIISMLLVFLIVESNLGIGAMAYGPKKEREPWVEPAVTKFTLEDIKPIEVEKPKTVEKERKPVKTVQSNQFTQVVNTSTSTESPTEPSEVDPEGTIAPSTAVATVPSKTEKKFLFNVQSAPIFPGCESLQTEQERRACLDEKINAFIGRKFNSEKFSDKYAGKKNRIDVEFTVDAKGEIVDIKTRSAYEDLGLEARRVIGSLPKLTPGKHNNQQVEVVYTVPISLDIKY